MQPSQGQAVQPQIRQEQMQAMQQMLRGQMQSAQMRQNQLRQGQMQQSRSQQSPVSYTHLKKDGTIIYFGCPAEEGAGSKQFMTRAGLFDNVDFVYTLSLIHICAGGTGTISPCTGYAGTYWKL